LGLDFFYDAFLELNSCRFLGMSEGPIPWTAMNTYCEAFEITGEQKHDLFYIIRSLDNAYLKYQADKQEKKTRQAKKPVSRPRKR
jgi:hypothetical protein